jgi:hypothetical protein
LSPRGQHPGKYVSNRGIDANPTANATAQYNPSTGSFSLADQAQIYGIAIELSAQTGALASVPHPFGKPGGPGLWGVKNMELPPYIQNIARALLRTGRAKTLGQAIAMAKAATERWKTGKNTRPEVRAASAATDADWDAKRAVARSHSNTGQRETLLAHPNHGPNGQFTTAQNAQQGQGKSKLPSKYQHMSPAARKRAKGRLLLQAHADQQKANSLRAQLHALIAQLHSPAAPKKSSASKKPASTKPASTKPASTKPKPASHRPLSAKAQAARQRISALRAQIHQLEASARAAIAQAAQL